jgi:hypothetical protein
LCLPIFSLSAGFFPIDQTKDSKQIRAGEKEGAAEGEEAEKRQIVEKPNRKIEKKERK